MKKKNLNTSTSNEIINFDKNIILNNICLTIDSKKIISNIDLLIKKNSCLGIKGESGSGKSSLINILLGLIEPNEGNIKVDEKIIKLISEKKERTQIFIGI